MKPPSARVKRTRSVLVEPRAPYKVKAGIFERCSSFDMNLGLLVMSFDMCKYSTPLELWREIGRATQYISRSRRLGRASDQSMTDNRVSRRNVECAARRRMKRTLSTARTKYEVWSVGSLSLPNRASADACLACCLRRNVSYILVYTKIGLDTLRMD